MKKLFLLLLVLISLPLAASHIVGGEFELLHLQGNQYRLNLIYYFDVNNNNFRGQQPENNEPTLTAFIYRKSDDQRMMTVSLRFFQKTHVSYTQPECSKGEVITDKLIYTAVIQLPADNYSDPKGYYVAWERCCRNYTITNIFSLDPTSSSDKAAGQTFYLEFPPVSKNGSAFINSSPRSFPALNDYACVKRPYYVDFTGVDDDGDSLAYSLTTPLSTHSYEAVPPTLSQPYPLIKWRPGYSLTATTQGNPDLKITPGGFITVTPPNIIGPYVFAVKIEEYRNKVKIGETRRDFQLFVVDCEEAFPPQITGKKLSDASFTYDGLMSVTFNNSVGNDDRCIEVRVSDPDASRIETGKTENIRIRVVGLNFKDPNLNKILPAEVSGTLVNGSTKDFKICFPSCPYIKGPYQVGIIAMDDACSLPLLDTLKVTVNVEPPVNHDPYFTTPSTTSATIKEGTSNSWPFEVKDDDGDELVLYFLTDGFVVEDAGMKTTITDQQNGIAKGNLSWDAFCDVYLFNQRTNFRVKVLVDDMDECKLNDPVVAEYNLGVQLPGNADPIIDTDLTANPAETEVKGLERKINQSLIFKVSGSDLVDNDFIALRMVPKDFKAADYGISFQKKTGTGLLQSGFAWELRCDKIDLKTKDEFEFYFMAIDSTNKCRVRKADTVRVQVKIFPPDNSAPRLTITSLNPEQPLIDNQLYTPPGKTIVLQLQGTDADLFPAKDSLNLSLKEKAGDYEPEGYTFTNAKGIGSVSSTFTWNPGCDIFQNEVYENRYQFKFYLKDNKCYNSKADSLTVSMVIKDVESQLEKFVPVNVFTPNDDGFNDYYTMQIINATTGELINLLPPDNCTGQFEVIRIVNRWGVQVFESTDRNFKWSGKDQAAGVYYYQIKYSNREYKGPLSLRN